MLFKDIPGLDETKASLIKAVKNDHVAHAQMFYGTVGSANFALALAFARYINCEDQQETDACGVCGSCRKIDKMAHPDVTFLFPTSSTPEIKESLSKNFMSYWRTFIDEHAYRTLRDWSVHFGAENKQANISVEESRTLIRNLSYKSFEGKYKIVLIWLPELMNQAASNSILKVLEEPPERTLFFLIPQNTDNILITILSRCQLMKVRSFQDDEVIQYLTEKSLCDEAKAKEISRLVEGNLNKAIKLSSRLTDDQSQLFQTWMRNCWTFAVQELITGAVAFQRMNKDSQKGILQTGLNLIREALVNKGGGEEVSRVLPEDEKFVGNFAKALSNTQLGNITDKLNTALYHLERNINPQMIYLDTSFDIYKILKAG